MNILRKLITIWIVSTFFLLVFPFFVSAQSHRLKAFELAYKTQDQWGDWTDWSDWEDCDIDISMNLDNSRIRIFSKEIQDYSIIKYLNDETDDNGKSYVMKCMDAEGLICTIKLREQRRPKALQLYIEYNNMRWVYNVGKY